MDHNGIMETGRHRLMSLGGAVTVREAVVILVLLTSGLQAQGSGPLCEEGEFSGEARQGQTFSRELVGGLKFSVDPMRLKEDPRWAWFQIRVVGTDDESLFVFHQSDNNWLLATDFWSAFIGGANSDLDTALQYRLRYLVFPISVEDKENLRRAADALHSARTTDEIEKSVRAVRKIPLGVIRFEIMDYGLGESESPMSVDWVKFTVHVTFPPEFSRLGSLLVTNTECRAMPREVIQNIRSPERHRYFLSPQ